MLIQLVYVSEATRQITDKILMNLLTVSRKRNSEAAITGMLLFSKSGKDFGKFTQLLEGTPDEVHKIFHSIKNDDRHKNVTVLLENPILFRSCPDWAMGFKPVNKSDFKNEDDWFEFSRKIETDEQADQAKRAIKLMKLFYDEFYKNDQNGKIAAPSEFEPKV